LHFWRNQEIIWIFWKKKRRETLLWFLEAKEEALTDLQVSASPFRLIFKDKD